MRHSISKFFSCVADVKEKLKITIYGTYHLMNQSTLTQNCADVEGLVVDFCEKKKILHNFFPGMVGINEGMISAAEAAFGGVKASLCLFQPIFGIFSPV